MRKSDGWSRVGPLSERPAIMGHPMVRRRTRPSGIPETGRPDGANPTADLSGYRSAYLVGIGGTGMCAGA